MIAIPHDNVWGIALGDVRVAALQKLLNLLPEGIENHSERKIIEASITALSHLGLGADEEAAIKTAMLDQNRVVLDGSLPFIKEEIDKLNALRVAVISLGCGDISLFERSIAQYCAQHIPNIAIEWLGVDIGDFRAPESFFNEHLFKVISLEAPLVYRTLITKNIPTLLVGRYSFHHLGVSFDQFMERCKGLARVIVVEEPTTDEKWVQGEYRVMRIAFDVLGNYIFSKKWAAEFMQDPNKFKIKYLTLDELPDRSNVITFKSMMPETATISFEPTDVS
ncbi:MAG: hypothetical protein AAB964_01290 [Patescibacteria group bacterium]